MFLDFRSLGVPLDNAEEHKERKRLFSELKAEIFKRQLSNAENFDKSVLTYSSAGLGFSLAFLKDFLPITKAQYGWLLYSSWGLFTLAIIVTIFSYVISQRGLTKQLNRAERYYLKCEEKAWKEINVFDPLTEILNNMAGLFFIVAIVFTTLFVSINLERATTMSEQKNGTSQEGAFKAAPIPSMQRIEQAGDLREAAPIPQLQQVPQPQPQPQQPQQQPQQQGPAQSDSPTGGDKE